MKKQLVILLSFILISCGGSGGDDAPPKTTPPPTPTPTTNNVAPSVPSLFSPTDRLLCTDNPLGFTWGISTDPDGDPVSYEIQVATNNGFTNDLQTKTVSNTLGEFSLLKGVAYYWRVRAKDSKNNLSAYSTTRKYYTEGDGVSNHLPYAPSWVLPVLNSTIIDVSTTLSWTASDVDNDPLTYDVYFGNSNPPALILENTSNTSQNVDLATYGTYYWKIVVKDDRGGQAIGQVWSFNVQ